MSAPQNPFGLHSVTPYLVVSDVKRLISFLEEVFEAEVRGDLRYRADDSIQHAEITIGDSVIMMNEPGAEDSELRVTASVMYTYVGDCDSAFDKAINLGAELVAEPGDSPHGDRYGGVRDFAGNLWWIVTHKGKH